LCLFIYYDEIFVNIFLKEFMGGGGVAIHALGIEFEVMPLDVTFYTRDIVIDQPIPPG